MLAPAPEVLAQYLRELGRLILGHNDYHPTPAVRPSMSDVWDPAFELYIAARDGQTEDVRRLLKANAPLEHKVRHRPRRSSEPHRHLLSRRDTSPSLAFSRLAPHTRVHRAITTGRLSALRPSTATRRS